MRREELFERLDIFEVMSIRKGFAGRWVRRWPEPAEEDGGRRGLNGADLIPHDSELFLGFTLDAEAGLGPEQDREPRDAGLLGRRARRLLPARGRQMHLSHIAEDLEAWYVNFDFAERAATAFRPGLKVKHGAQTVRRTRRTRSVSPRTCATTGGSSRIGHSRSIQVASRLQHGRCRDRWDHVSEGDGDPAARRLQHARQPVLLERESRARQVEGPSWPSACTLLSSTPTSDDFHRGRLAMDGCCRWDQARVHSARPRARLQLGADDDAPPELPRPATAKA